MIIRMPLATPLTYGSKMYILYQRLMYYGSLSGVQSHRDSEWLFTEITNVVLVWFIEINRLVVEYMEIVLIALTDMTLNSSVL